MKRRDFLKNSIILAATSSFVSSCNLNEKSYKKNFISGFVFSDAHIGWKGSDQPTVQEQSQAIQTIKQRFKNLDIVFDTGDIHHGYLNEEERISARDDWLSLMANQFPTSIFHYVPGNHELGKCLYDSELTASKLGSQNLRPYYSFDYKGIHFISLPELTDTILVNKESLEWLSHDLYLNKEKTTLIFSHNSISGTTYNNNETGYRVLVNSNQVLDIINKHGNVIAWLHGHNHQYQIVKKEKRLYVSNGRIGGFDPPESWGQFGHGHLGGIYFTINEKGLEVKCFSATKNNFFYNLGYNELSQSLKIKTSFNSKLGMNYYFGHGSLTNNVTHKVSSHYLSLEDKKIFTKKNISSTLNENEKFGISTELFFSGKKINRTIGYQFLPKNIKRKTTNNGLLIEKGDNTPFTINLPKNKETKDGFMSRPSYFRSELGDVFNLLIRLKISSDTRSTENIKCIFTIYSLDHTILYKSNRISLPKKENVFQTDKLIVSRLDSNKIKKDEPKYFRLSIEFNNFSQSITISEISLSKKVEETNPRIYINKKEFVLKDKLNHKLPNSEILKSGISEIKFMGKTPTSCIIKIPNVVWQIRNATTTFDNNRIELLNYRHTYQKINEVVLTPTKPFAFYLNKVVDIMPLTVEYKGATISIKLIKINSNSLLVFSINTPPKNIIGAKIIRMLSGTLTLRPETKNIEIMF